VRRNYNELSPEIILNAIESLGISCDGRMQALNSFENRVYMIGIYDGDVSKEIVAKFYRPNRWSKEQIIEEHQFSLDLYQAEIPVVPPSVINGKTLFSFDTPDAEEPFFFSLFEKKGGRAPNLEDFDTLEQLGRYLGRIHQLGSSKSFTHRPQLDPDTYGTQSRTFLLENDFIPRDLLPAYESLTEELIKGVEDSYKRAGDIQYIRTHSDAHPGNILETPNGFHIVDFDDSRMTPASQDLWMFLSADRADATAGLDALLEGYTQFKDFNARELHLIEALRTLRLMHYYAWLARRWDDPAFKIAFPWFNSQQCWEQHVLSLREQQAALYEEPLNWFG